MGTYSYIVTILIEFSGASAAFPIRFAVLDVGTLPADLVLHSDTLHHVRTNGASVEALPTVATALDSAPATPPLAGPVPKPLVSIQAHGLLDPADFDVAADRATPLLRDWTEFTRDELRAPPALPPLAAATEDVIAAAKDAMRKLEACCGALAPDLHARGTRAFTALFRRAVPHLTDPRGANVSPFDDVDFDPAKTARLRHERIHAPVPPQHREAAAALVARLTAADIIEPTTSSFSVPALFLPKPGVPGAIRFVTDMRSINACARSTAALPRPGVLETRDAFVGAKVFLTMDIADAYFQFRVSDRVARLLVFNVDGRLYRFKRLPQGFTQSGTGLWLAIQHMYGPLLMRPSHGIMAAADDLALYAPDAPRLIEVVEEVAAVHDRHNVYIKKGKVQGPDTSVTWAGWRVTPDGVTLHSRFTCDPTPPFPLNGAELQVQLGAARFFLPAVPGLAPLTAPLQDQLTAAIVKAHGSMRAPALKRVPIAKTPPLAAAHETMWAAIRRRPLLAHVVPGAVRVVKVDASNTRGWGATTSQAKPERWDLFRAGKIPLIDVGLDPVLFQSGMWSASQLNWPSARLELFALVNAILDSPYIPWRDGPVQVITDCQDLAHWLTADGRGRLTPRNAAWAWRWLSHLDEYAIDVWYQPGESPAHFLVDSMSRNAPPDESAPAPASAPRAPNARPSPTPAHGARVAAVRLDPTHNALGAFDPELATFNLKTLVGAPAPADPRAFRLKQGLWRDAQDCVYVHDPTARLRLLVVAHSGTAGHRGADATLRMLRRHFTWPDVAADTHAFVRRCLTCRALSGPARELISFGVIPHGQRFNQIVHVDHASMRPSSTGHANLLVMVDDMSKYTVLTPTKSVSAADTAEAFLDHWIAPHGGPDVLVSDRGRAFNNAVLQRVTEALGTQTHLTVANVSQTNGTAERAIREVRRILDAFATESRTAPADWPAVIPAVMNALNHTPSDRLAGFAPVTLAFNHEPRDPISLLRRGDDFVQFLNHLVDSAHESLVTLRREAADAREHRRAREAGRQNRRARADEPPNLAPGTFVLVSTRLTSKTAYAPTWARIAQVVSRDSPWLYTIRHLHPPHHEEQRHVQHLRHFEDAAYAMPAAVKDSLAFQARLEYTVDSFLDLRREGDVFQVLTRWAGFPDPEPPEWEPVQTMLRDVPTMLHAFVRDYERKHPRSQLLTALFRRFPQLRREAV